MRRQATSSRLYALLVLTLVLALVSTVVAKCPRGCTGHGNCNKYSQCECHAGYIGGDCSLKSCPNGNAWSDFAYATDKAHAPAECSARGICDRLAGTCTCQPGFGGAACERLDCNANCNGNGKCYTMHNLAKQTRNSMSQSYIYDKEFGSYGVWDAEKIQGCKCDPLYTGYDCSLFDCSKGDDPLTPNQVNEVQLVKCIATTGTFTLWYQGAPSAAIPYDASAATVKAALLQIKALTAVDVVFSIPQLKACQINANIIKITFTEQFGPQSPIVARMDSAMAAVGVVTVVANGVTPMTDFSGVTSLSVKGNKENEICAGRGKCMAADGLCSCFDSNGDTYASSDGYGKAGSRGDCGYIASGITVATCPGQIQCNGHGLCDAATHKCSCVAGWEGGDCSDRTCPIGLDWFSYPSANNFAHNKYSTCSNMGLCDLTLGKCACRDNFYGQACEFMACGGGMTNPCSNHGRCMSMKELATWSKKNGEEMPYTYGMNPNEGRTWDADRVHGCLCDKGYTGYDCSQKVCPTGDDPFTYDQHVEVQLMTCTATQGTFKLTFREETTAPIQWNANADEIRDALMLLPTLVAGGVTWQKSSRNSWPIHPKVENGATTEVINYPLRVYFKLDTDMPYGVIEQVKPPKYPLAGDPRPWMPHFLADGHNTTFLDRSQIRNVTSTFCNQRGDQVAVISFDGIHGDVPGITSDTTDLGDMVGIVLGQGSVTLYEDGASHLGLDSVKGTTEDIECNGRGTCNREWGFCECYEDWSSSDGTGNSPGYIGDCGYKAIRHASTNSFSEGRQGLQNENPFLLQAN